MRTARTRRRGFSLIEMVLVVLIVSILVVIMIPNLLRAKYRAQLVTCTDDIKAIVNACELYKIEYKLYPDDINANLDFTTNYLHAPTNFHCPTNPFQPYTYLVNQNDHIFTVICEYGVHYRMMGDVVDQYYPQYSHLNGKIILH